MLIAAAYHSAGYEFEANQKPIFDFHITKFIFRSSGDLNFVTLVDGLRYWWSEFGYRQDGILTCFSILILWTLCGKPMRGRPETIFCWLLFFEGALIVGGWGLRLKVLFGVCIFLFMFFSKLVGLNPEVRAKYLATQYLLATGWILTTHTSTIYLVDELIHLFQVLLKEMRVMCESNVLFSLFLVLIKGMRG